MNAVAKTEKKRSSAPFWILLAIFAAPVVAAWFFYLNPDFRPAGTTNKGELISPILPLSAEVALLTPEGAELDGSVLEGKWTLVYLAGGECTDACLDRLIAIRQIRLALGEGQISVGRLLILTDPAAADLASDLEAKFDGMQVALTDVAGGARLLDRLGEGNAALDRIYILDPMSNLMMRYARNAPAKDTLKDMERLLKASKNWIKGAEYGH